MNKIEELIEKFSHNGIEYKLFGEIALIQRGASPRPISSFITNDVDGVNWIKIGDVKEGSKFITNTNEKITREGAKKSRYIKKGSLILSNSMSFGRPYILDIDGCIHDGWLSISNFEKYYSTEFLYYLLSSRKIQNEFEKKASFGGAVQNLNADIVRNISLPVPPLEVQHEIVHILDDFTLLSAELSAELKARQKQYEYYLHHLLDIKEGKEMTIGDIYDFKYGTGNTIPEGGGEYPVYGSNGMVGYYSEYNSEDAPVIGHIGAYAGIVNWAKGKHFVTYNGVICKHKNMNVDKRYAYYMLLTQDFIGEQKGAQPFVSYDALKKPIVKIPELKEQQRIVNILDRFDKLCNDILEGLPAEIEARQKQYEYYRDKLLTFKELVNEG